MPDYVLPAEYPYQDSPATSTPLRSDDYNALLVAMNDLAGPSGRVATIESGLSDVTRTSAYGDPSDEPNGAPAALTSGQALTVFGNATITIAGGEYVHTPFAGTHSAGYLQANLGTRVARIGCDVVFPAGSTGTAALVMPSAAWADGEKPAAGIHFVVEADGDWHVSNWNGNSEDANYAAGSLGSLADGVSRRVEITLDLVAGVAYLLLPDGSAARIADPRLASNTSTYAIWELYEFSGAGAVPGKFARVWADVARSALGGATVEDVARVAAAATYATGLSPTTIALLGDSITNQNSDDANWPWYDAKGYFTWANALLGQRFTIVTPTGSAVGEFGASGLTVQQLIDGGHVAAAAASPAAWVVVHAGTNSLSLTPDVIRDQLVAVWRTLLAGGKRVVATTILPRDNAGDTTLLFDRVRETNHLIRLAARSMPGVVLCDWYAMLVDPTTGKANLDYLYDGVHPDAVGATRMGRLLADTLAPLTAPSEAWSPLDAADVRGFMPNPFMLGDVAGVATGLTYVNIGAATVIRSKAPRTDGIPGEWQQLRVTSSPPNTAAQVYQTNTALGSDLTTGDRVFAVAEFETDAEAWTGRQLMLNLFFEGAAVNGATAGRAASGEITGLTASLLRPTSGVLRTPTVTVPAGTTGLTLTTTFAGTGTVRLGRYDVIKAV